MALAQAVTTRPAQPRSQARCDCQVPRITAEGERPDTIHAEHQGQQGKFDFSGELIIGNIQSRTALRLIRKWAILHQAELQIN